MTPLEIVKFEMDNQVGLYDGVNLHSATGLVSDNSFNETRIFCGFSKKYKLKSDVSQKIKELSRIEWKECAKAVIDELKANEYDYELATLYYNGFILEEK